MNSVWIGQSKFQQMSRNHQEQIGSGAQYAFQERFLCATEKFRKRIKICGFGLTPVWFPTDFITYTPVKSRWRGHENTEALISHFQYDLFFDPWTIPKQDSWSLSGGLLGKEVVVSQFSKGDISPLQKMALLTAWGRGAKGRAKLIAVLTIAKTAYEAGAVRNAKVRVKR